MITDELHEKDLEQIRKFRLMDDDFMTRVFDKDTELTQFVLRIIMEKDDLIVTAVESQEEIHNLRGHSIRLDVFASDADGKIYDIEIQRADRGAGRKRARYNSSLIDGNDLPRGNGFDELPESYVIFITENDTLGRGFPIYHIERVIIENYELFNDGEHIIYVNGQNSDGETEIGKLIHDLQECDPEDMFYPLLAQKTRYFKESEEGVAIMCKAMEEMRDETALNTQKEIIKNMLSSGMSPSTIAEVTKISIDTVNDVQKELQKNSDNQ